MNQQKSSPIATLIGLVMTVGLAGMAVGCQDAFDRDGRDAFVCESCTESDTGVAPDTDADTGTDTGTNPDTDAGPSAPQPPCAPRPTVEQANRLPQRPDDLQRGSCRLEKVTRDASRNSGLVEEWTITDDKIVRTKPSPASEPNRTTWWLTSAGEVRKVEKRRYTRFALRVQTWTFDGRGRLTARTYDRYEPRDAEQPAKTKRMSQQFDDGKLIKRVRNQSGFSPEGEQTVERFQYDGEERLSRVDVTSGNGADRTIDWTYQLDRPVEVEHRLDGEVVYEQSWVYGEAGRLASRSISIEENAVPRAPGAERSTDMTPWSLPHGSYTTDDTWRASVPEGRESCRRLPYSAAHGYPDDEKVYRLLWRQQQEGELPEGIDRAYGFQGFGVYNDYGWYGHGGVYTPWPLTPRRFTGQVDVTITYGARERMTREQLRLTTETDDGDPTHLRFRRERSFEGERLVEDRVVATRHPDGADEPDARAVRTLAFSYDDGHLQRRRLRFGDQVVEQQKWDHKDGRDTEVAIERHPDMMHVSGGSRLGFDHTEPIADKPLEQTGRYERKFDAEGRRTQMTRFGASSQRVHKTEYGPHGPTREVTTHGGGSQSVTTYAYDEAGRRTEKRRDTDDDGNPDLVETWQYAEDGRLLEHVRSYPPQEKEIRTQRAYVCGE